MKAYRISSQAMPEVKHDYRYAPCPFCGYREAEVRVRVRHRYNNADPLRYIIQAVVVTEGCKHDYAVVCPACDAMGPWALRKDLAIKLWEQRENNMAKPQRDAESQPAAPE